MIRSGGHLPKEEYDGHHGGQQGTTDPAELYRGRYKASAVRLVLDEGKTVAAAARDLGLTESSLRNWVEQARADRTERKTGLTTADVSTPLATSVTILFRVATYWARIPIGWGAMRFLQRKGDL